MLPEEKPARESKERNTCEQGGMGGGKHCRNNVDLYVACVELPARTDPSVAVEQAT